ncbi:MAG: transporter [Firmicutes bacterium]|nr:transporter [Bacillota bacterium]
MNKPINLAGRIDSLPLTKWHFLLIPIVCLGILFDAYDLTILSVALPQIKSQWNITDVQAGMLGSAGFAGMLIGALLSGYLADRYGRAIIFKYTIVLYSVFTVISAYATDFNMLVITRLIVGLGMGGLVPVGSAYLSEYIPSKIRGRVLAIFNAFFAIGTMLAYSMGALIVVPYGWKYGFLVGGIPIVLAIAAHYNLPESVRYLQAKGRIEEAVRLVEMVERKTVGKIAVPTHEAIEIEIASAATASEQKVKSGILDLFKGFQAKTTVMVAVMWFCVGYAVNAIVVWLPIFLTREFSYSLALGLKYMSIASIVGITGNILAGVCVDYLGRKKTIVVAFIMYGFMSYVLFAMGKNLDLGPVLLAGIFFLVGMMNGSAYAYSPENFPTRLRGTGLGLGSAVGRVGGMLGPTVIGIVYSTHGIYTVAHLNMLVLIVGAIIVALLGRETVNKSLEELDATSAKKPF